MQRSKLKLAVILLLALLNVVLLGMIVMQDRESHAYAETGRVQALVWLERNGIDAEETVIPWVSTLTDRDVPEGVTVQARRNPETLLRDFVVGLRKLGTSCARIESVLEEYVYADAENLLTPVWVITTDTGTFRLDCGSGALSYEL